MLYALAAFAVYRLARDFTMEEGPFMLYARIQAWVEARDPGQTKWYYRGLQCPMCISFWLALFATLALAPASLPMFLITWLGLAGGAAFLIRLAG